MASLTKLRIGGVLLPLVILWVVMALTSDRFLTFININNVLVQFSIIGVLAVGTTFVVITREIDLSIGSIMGFCAVTAALTAVTLRVALADRGADRNLGRRGLRAFQWRDGDDRRRAVLRRDAWQPRDRQRACADAYARAVDLWLSRRIPRDRAGPHLRDQRLGPLLPRARPCPAGRAQGHGDGPQLLRRGRQRKGRATRWYLGRAHEAHRLRAERRLRGAGGRHGQLAPQRR
ncbi:MAG: ABC transporter permease [Alphaproteobacteria bacterium]|nr:ABC transporter permease [Alphaproteobacteria bacterium]